MIIYYLLVKTHSVTGLKYLCQTVQNPFNYKGSGTVWKRHLKKHGKEHDTYILQKCYSKESLKSWGLYYSKAWSIVESKQWANLIPEDGGGFACGKYHPQKTAKTLAKNSLAHTGHRNYRYNHTVYLWRHKDGREISMTRYDFINTYGANKGTVNQIFKGNRKAVKGWTPIL